MEIIHCPAPHNDIIAKKDPERRSSDLSTAAESDDGEPNGVVTMTEVLPTGSNSKMGRVLRRSSLSRGSNHKRMPPKANSLRNVFTSSLTRLGSLRNLTATTTRGNSSRDLTRSRSQRDLNRSRSNRRAPPPCKVHFDEDANVWHHNDAAAADDCDSDEEDEIKWYSPIEIAWFREDTLQEASRLSNSKETCKVLEKLYEACYRTRKNTLVLSKQQQADMLALYNNNDESNDDDNKNVTVLGIERLLIPRFRKDKVYLRKGFLDIVRDLRPGKTTGSKTDIAQNIASVSEELSRPSRLFAQHLGKAQEQQEQQQEEALQQPLQPPPQPPLQRDEQPLRAEI